MRKIINKIFLVKEIRNQKGELHFKRWRVIETPWFSIYVHYIAKSDEDKDPHNHPWKYDNIILSGGYIEDVYIPDMEGNKQLYGSYEYKPYLSSSQYHGTIGPELYHKIRLKQPTWSLFFAGKRKLEKWGYLTDKGFVPFDEYRKSINNYEDID